VVAEQQLPFTLQVPNKATRQAMAEAEEIATGHKTRFSGAEELFDSLEKDSGK
jgi:antitoxin component of RelBE/YafQ-DinJ toxin-antitoxin module